MNSQNDKDSSPHIRAAVIAGIFAVVAACIGGVFLVIVAFINNGFIFAGAGNQNQPIFQPASEIAPQSQPTNPAIYIPLPTSSSEQSIIQMEGPFRDHQIASIGTGMFTQVTFSDGNAPYSSNDLNTDFFQIYGMRLEDNPNGCGVSTYNTDKVWVTGSVNTTFTINGQEIGKLSVSTGKHGFIANWDIRAGDKICATNIAPSGFSVILGPDMYYHYDSFCYRGLC